jgi:malate dehydrogenase (oxaloacetate-decarboxylating)
MAANNPSIAYSITIRAQYSNESGMLGTISSAIGDVEGDISSIETVKASRITMVRDITVNARDVAHGEKIAKNVRALRSVKVLNVSEPVFQRHLGGKIEVASRTPVETDSDMSIVYTPGVGRVSMAIHHDPEALWTLTGKGNTVGKQVVLGISVFQDAAMMPPEDGPTVLGIDMSGGRHRTRTCDLFRVKEAL